MFQRDWIVSRFETASEAAFWRVMFLEHTPVVAWRVPAFHILVLAEPNMRMPATKRGHLFNQIPSRVSAW